MLKPTHLRAGLLCCSGLLALAGCGSDGSHTGGDQPDAGVALSATELPPGHNPTVWPVAADADRCADAPRAEVTSIAVAPSGEIYLAGTYSGTPDFGSGALRPDALAGENLFVAKFDAQGNPAWAASYTGTWANVKVDHMGRPVFAATTSTTATSGGSGTLRQLDPSNGRVQWEYAYSWPAGYYSERIGLAAGTNTTLAIPGKLVNLDSNGRVAWQAAMAQSGPGEPGGPLEVVESASGELTAFTIDYLTRSPRTYHYRLISFSPTGEQRWTRKVEADTNQPLYLSGDAAGKAAIFGTAYGETGIEGSAPLSLVAPGDYLGITSPAGEVLAQQELDQHPVAATWQRDRLVTVNLVNAQKGSSTSYMTAYSLAFAAIDTAGLVTPLPEAGLPTLINPTVLMATQGDKVLVTGAREKLRCYDCTECFQTRPYLMRLDASGIHDTTFGDFMP